MKKKIIKILGYFFTALIFFYIGKCIYTNINELKTIPQNFNIVYLIGSFLILIVYLFNLTFIWYFITKKNQCELTIKRSVIFKTYSVLGKYIPGKVGSITMLYYYYRNEQKSLKKVSVSLILENACSILSAIFIFILSLFFIDILFFQQYKYIAVLMLIFLLILINPKILEYFLNLLLKITKREKININFTYKTLLIIILMYIINWFIFGFALFLFVNSLYYFPIHNFFFLLGSLLLSAVIGYFAFFTPSGIGVREGVLTLCLKHSIPISIAGVISIASRLLLIAGDMLLFFIIFIYAKRKNIKIKN